MLAPDKPAGSRISIEELHPGSYFPIFDADDMDKLIGVHIADQMLDPKDKRRTLIRRQTYRKNYETGSLRISSELAWFETDGWDLRPESEQKKEKLVRVDVPEFLLPESITALPVYHVRNNRETVNPFGSSEMRGFERLMVAINQAISDEEFALAMDGIGTYVTNAEAEDGAYRIGPGFTQLLNGSKEEVFFNRISGVTSVSPWIEHLKYLDDKLFVGSGTPPIARGAVDVSVAESGIALLLQLSPLLSKNKEKETELLGVYDQMYYDLLNGWMPAYEQLSFPGAAIHPIVGDPMPIDREAEFERVMTLIDKGLLSRRSARLRLAELGYEFEEDEEQQVAAEKKATALAEDPYANRAGAEQQEGSAVESDGGEVLF